MAEALKNILGEDAVRWLADGLQRVWPGFGHASFVADCLARLDGLELKDRANHMADAMARHLPGAFPEAARIIARSLGPTVEATGENGPQVLRYMAHDAFIARFGLEHPREAFRLQEELTQRFTCEFSIRSFIERHPEETYAQLRHWANSSNAHLRRLVSEGTRPRLPWAPRLAGFQRDPQPVIALLEMLKDDPVRYVQRSVANSINDIGKDHPAVAVELCRRWLEGAGDGRRWIAGHAMRSLVKAGHPGALSLMGAGDKPRVRFTNIRWSPKAPKIGGLLKLEAGLESTARTSQTLIVDFRVFFVKANGMARPKVFKLKKLVLGSGESVSLSASVSFAAMTTRKHYPGAHRIEFIVNGVSYEAVRFTVKAASQVPGSA